MPNATQSLRLVITPKLFFTVAKAEAGNKINVMAY
jgi:hypothetical protein